MSNPNAGQPGEGQAEARALRGDGALPHPALGSARHGAGRAGALPGGQARHRAAHRNGFYYDFDLGTDENGNPRTFTPEDLRRSSSG